MSAKPEGSGSVATARQEYAATLADLERDRERILALWREGLAQNGMPEAKFDWYYRRNPEGSPSVLFLHPAGSADPVGAASLGRRRMRLGVETIEAGALADFIVVAAHRSFFPALYLQQAMRRHGLASRRLVYGIPNPQSEAIVRRVGYKRVGELVRWARVLRSGAYFSRHAPGWLASTMGAVVDRALQGLTALRAKRTGTFHQHWTDEPPADAGALWEKAAARGLLIGARDARFLAWRFSQCPLYRCRFLSLRRADTGALAAYAACLERDDSTHVADFLVDADVPEAADRMWLEVSFDAARRGSRSASVEFLGPESVVRSLEAAGWIARERRALYAAFEGLEPPADALDWYVTAADEDA
jgi:hypothetical protein